MMYEKLGETGIRVSRLGLGTVELGLDYGINKPGDFGIPAETTALRLLHRAADAGINLFDTAPSYGCSEELLGKAFADREECLIATKVNIPLEDEDAEKVILSSVTQSCQNLQRESLDIVQVHNATADTFARSNLFEILQQEKDRGTIRFLGASVYEPENALAAIDSGKIDVLQIAYNILDQRMDEEVLDKAASAGIGILSRSVYLKGVLTERINWLPDHCAPLRRAVERIKSEMNLVSWNDLSRLALRFVLSNPRIHSVLVGVRSEEELNFALDTYNKGSLSTEENEVVSQCRITDAFWLNPSNWELDE